MLIWNSYQAVIDLNKQINNKTSIINITLTSYKFEKIHAIFIESFYLHCHLNKIAMGQKKKNMWQTLKRFSDSKKWSLGKVEVISTVKIFNGATYRRRIKKKKSWSYFWSSIFFFGKCSIRHKGVISLSFYGEKCLTLKGLKDINQATRIKRIICYISEIK